MKILRAFLPLYVCVMLSCDCGSVLGHKEDSNQVRDEELHRPEVPRRILTRQARSQGYLSVNQELAVLADFVQEQILRKKLQEARDYLNNL